MSYRIEEGIVWNSNDPGGGISYKDLLDLEDFSTLDEAIKCVEETLKISEARIYEVETGKVAYIKNEFSPIGIKIGSNDDKKR